MHYYQAGWKERPAGSPVGCAIRLANFHADKDAAEPLVELTTQADEFFGQPGNDLAAADFYNELVRVTKRVTAVRCREDLRDRALVGLALKLRQRFSQGTAAALPASSLFKDSTAWPAALVNDAQFAIRRKKPRLPAFAASRKNPSKNAVREAM